MREISFEPKLTTATTATTATGAAMPAGGNGFASALKSALDGVSASQTDAEHLARAFQTGETPVGLEETMVAIAKANVSFQTLVQVRNRLVSAYHEIMNMPI